EKKVDYNNPKNLLLTAVVLGLGLSGAKFTIGTVTIKGMILSTFAAIILSITFKLIEKTSKTE
ncbi:MAG: uracil permease, partial [Elusimicrobia bacterium]|nr:uracil permease [Elusimicrobiota bacterium]